MKQQVVVSRRRFLHLSAGTLGVALGGSAFLSACGGGSLSNAPVVTPRLASVPNFRDVAGSGGTGYVTTSGRTMRKGVVYRSSALSLSASDLATVDTLGITHVYDLRTTAEIDASPDVVPTGAIDQNLNVLGSLSGVNMTSLPTNEEDAVAFMQATYQALVTADSALASYHALFRGLANDPGSQLYHCTAGKDRTGWATAILQSIVGLPLETIYADYLLSNTYLAATIAAAVAKAQQASGTAAAQAIQVIQGVQKSFLQTAFNQVTATYGSMNAYLSNGLQLDAATQAEIRRKLLA